MSKYRGYVALFSHDTQRLNHVLSQLLKPPTAQLFASYLNYLLRDQGPMDYAGRGEHLTFVTDNGTIYAIVVGKRKNMRAPERYTPTLIFAVHYPSPRQAPGGQFRYEHQVASDMGATLCIPLDDKSPLINQMLKLYRT